MTTTEIRTSAHPPAVAELVPQARDLADRLGELPSRNRIMREFRVGAGKAGALLTALTTPAAGDEAPTVPVTAPAITIDAPAAPPVPVGQPAALPEVAPALTVAPSPVVVPVADRSAGRVSSWPVWLLALPAFVAIWSGWVGLGGLTGFGVVHPLPGIWDSLAVNTAITLPIGMEAYAAFALRVWLSSTTPGRARRFAKWSAIGALLLGAVGQVAYHLMSAAGMTSAPWPITASVACLPVAVLGMGAALAHLITESDTESGEDR